MAHDIQDLIMFPGTGLNSDDDLLVMPSGDSRYRLNVMSSDDGNYDVLVNTKGNLIKSISLPSGDNVVIGFVENPEEDSCFYCLYNSTGLHSILEYSLVTDSVTYLLNGDDPVDPAVPAGPKVGGLLNFDDPRNWTDDDPHFVDMELIGNEDTKFLGMTDNYNPPRNLFLARIRGFTAGTSDGYNVLYEECINMYKKPPTTAIDASYQSNSSVSTNNLRGSLWQFCFRYVYPDNTKSTVSPYSNIALPEDEETVLKTYTSQSFENNFLYLVFIIPYATTPGIKAIKGYEVLYRKVNYEGATGDWFLWDYFEYKTVGGQLLNFYNNTGGVAVDQKDIIRPYDYVPDLARTITSINSNRFVLGGVTEGQVVEFASDPTITLTPRLVEFEVSPTPPEEQDCLIFYDDTASPVTTSGGTGTLLLPSPTNGYSLIIRIGTGRVLYTSFSASTVTVTKDSNKIVGVASTFLTDLSVGDVILLYSAGQEFTVKYIEDQLNLYAEENSEEDFTIAGSYLLKNERPILSGFVTINDTSIFSTKNDLAVDVRSKINLILDSDVVLTIDGSDDILITNNNATFSVIFDVYWFDKNNIKYSWKSGATHYFGLRYGFGGKLSYVYTDSSADVYVETLAESHGGGSQYNNKRYDIDWNLSSPAPAGAIDYQWVYLGSDIDYSEQYFVSNSGTFFEKGFVYENGYYNILKTELAQGIIESNNNKINYGFDIQAGDRIRLIGLFETESFQSVLVTSGVAFSIFASNSVEIFSESKNYSITGVDDQYVYTDIPDLRRGQRYLIEIYRPKLISSNGVYQEISPVYTITSNTHDTTSGTFDFGDVFIDRMIYRNKSSEDGNQAIVTAFCEKKPYSVLFDSIIYDWGRYNSVNENAVIKEYFKIRWSGPFIDESGANFLSKFDFDDERDVDDRNGVVTFMRQVGNTLKVYQERKVNSFYLAGVTSVDPSGQMQVSSSTQIMDTSARQAIDDWGCTHYSSFAWSVRTNYFFDLNNASVVRDSANGLISVSDAKMKTFFKNLSERIIAYGKEKVRITAEFDKFHDLYIISFFDLDDPLHLDPNDINYTLCFNERDNRWKSYFSYMPEYYGTLPGEKTLTFLDGDLYIQHEGTDRNNFFGVPYQSEIYVHSNKAPGEIKMFDSIELVSTGAWNMDDDGDVEITLPIPMTSRLKGGKLKLQEGVYRSELLRALPKLHDGKILRGHEIVCKLNNADTTEAILRFVKINSSISR